MGSLSVPATALGELTVTTMKKLIQNKLKGVAFHMMCRYTALLLATGCW